MNINPLVHVATCTVNSIACTRGIHSKYNFVGTNPSSRKLRGWDVEEEG